ncbi:hypothetical protein [Paenibacillus sp. GXUN7292]|uniref:hypothetical protein n=1 Tax=Paenibacillus sp. GXUN7292 TaxID=3422499 RepID=UPI003D7E8327
MAVMEKERTIDVPQIEVEGYVGETAAFLSQFYRLLGWNGHDELNPRCVVVNDRWWVEVAERLALGKDAEDKWIMMNYGPSGRSEIPYGKVRLLPGYVTSNYQKGE